MSTPTEKDLIREAGAAMQDAVGTLDEANALLKVVEAACEGMRQDHLVVALSLIRSRLHDQATQPLETQLGQLRRHVQDLYRQESNTP